MKRRGAMRTAVALCAVVIVIAVVLAGGYVFFVGGRSSPDGTYVESPSSIRSSLHASATSGQVTLRVNAISDASTRETRATWEQFNTANKSGSLYQHPLVPPAGEKYLVANITVTDTAHRAVPFAYTNMYLVGSDGHTYYANYAAGDASAKQLIKNHTLSSGASKTLYVLFEVPSQMQATKLVYASHPPIVVRLT